MSENTSGNDSSGEDRNDDNPFKGTPFEQIFSQLSGAIPDAAGSGFDLGGLMGQIQAMMNPHDGPVNWKLASDLARRTTAQKPDPAPTQADIAAVSDSMRLADHWLEETTVLPSGVAMTAAWSRAEWIESTSEVWKTLVEPIASSLVQAMTKALPTQAEPAAAPLMGIMSQAGGAMFGSQVGTALGYLAGEVLAACDIGLPLGPEGKGALVIDNVRSFAKGHSISFEDATLYLSLREAAHQRLFAHVPWLRDHLISSVEEFARGVTFDMSNFHDALGGLDPSNPEAMAEAINSHALQPEQTPEQKAALARLETTLALVEGWVDEVLGLATEERMPTAGAIQEAIRRRRAAGGPAEQTFAALVGLELRPRRLRDAAALWGSLRSRQGVQARDAVWAHPDLLPSAADLDDPLGFRDDMPAIPELTDEEFDSQLSQLLKDETGE